MPLNDLLTLPGVAAQPDAVTDGYVFNHTMIRVKDLTKALDFYTRVLGLPRSIWKNSKRPPSPSAT
ncbi:VOC family protein [Serratia ureilytica]|uniref:VOC family protein n=1 Tax=Serratia ureilytica TaxID=300181 RepID=UPI0022B299C0|nr:VOC family protein [Serratia ureilytica]